MKESTYILKRDVYNNETFPTGTIVKPINHEHYCFEVVEGKLKGKKGGIADGLNGWVCDDTKENRKCIKDYLNNKKEINKQLNINTKFNEQLLNNIPKSKIN